MHRIFAAVLAVFLSVCALPAQASTSGVVRGTIVVNDKLTAGVAVLLQGEGSLLRTSTDGAGKYIFRKFPLGITFFPHRIPMPESGERKSRLGRTKC